MEKFAQYKDSYIHFVEAGFIAVNQADEDAAIKLFKAAALLKPENTLPQLGTGYLHLCKLELKQAIQAFRDVLAKEAHNEMAKAFLGFALCLTPTEVATGEKQLEETIKTAHDPAIKELAGNALDFVEKFVKKPLPPMQAQKGEGKKKDKGKK